MLVARQIQYLSPLVSGPVEPLLIHSIHPTLPLNLRVTDEGGHIFFLKVIANKQISCILYLHGTEYFTKERDLRLEVAKNNCTIF